MSELGLELSKVLFHAEPDLLECDLEASARAAVAVSNLLGCIMATVLMKQGEEVYINAMKAVTIRIHKSAVETCNKAASASPNTTPQ